MIEVNIGPETVVLGITFVVSVLLPLLVGIVTTRFTSPARKAVVLIVLSFVASVLSEILNALVSQQPYDLVVGLVKFAGVAVVAIASYFGVWSRPTESGDSISKALVENVGRTAKHEAR